MIASVFLRRVRSRARSTAGETRALVEWPRAALQKLLTPSSAALAATSAAAVHSSTRWPRRNSASACASAALTIPPRLVRLGWMKTTSRDKCGVQLHCSISIRLAPRCSSCAGANFLQPPFLRDVRLRLAALEHVELVAVVVGHRRQRLVHIGAAV